MFFTCRRKRNDRRKLKEKQVGPCFDELAASSFKEQVGERKGEPRAKASRLKNVPQAAATKAAAPGAAAAKLCGTTTKQR